MDQRRKEASLCEGLADYMLGENTEVERKRFERHLAECPSCRMEATAWDDVWGELYRDMELEEPPADLKRQVLDSIADADGKIEECEAGTSAANREAAEVIAEPPSDMSETSGLPHSPERPQAALPQAPNGRPVRRRLVRWAAAVIAFVLVFAAGWWGNETLGGSPSAPELALPASSRIDQLLPLAADRSSGLLADYPQAYGVACIVSTSPDQPKQFIVYLFDAPKTEGNETYQVWLWSDGSRHSAGTLQVADSGIGVLTMPLTDAAPAIQAVGVTLESNGPSDAPQGPKLFGSSAKSTGWDV